MVVCYAAVGGVGIFVVADKGAVESSICFVDLITDFMIAWGIGFLCTISVCNVFTMRNIDVSAVGWCLI